MPTSNINGVSSSVSDTRWTGYTITRSNFAYPVARQASDLSRPAVLDQIALRISGRSASRSVRFQVMNTSGSVIKATSFFTIPSASSGVLRWGPSLDLFIANANGQTNAVGFQLSAGNQYVNYSTGTHSGNNVVYWNGSSWVVDWANQTLVGQVLWYQAPSAPTIVSVTPSGTQAHLVLSAPVDNGGVSVSGYVIERDTDPGFSNPVQVGVGTGLTHTVDSLLPGSTYYWRVTAQNSVTVRAGITGGAWSATVSATQPVIVTDLGPYFDGSFTDTALAEYAWTGAAQQSSSTLTGKGTVGFLVPTVGTSGGATVVQYNTDEASFVGSRSARFLWKSDPVSDGAWVGSAGITPALPGGQYSGSLHVRPSKDQAMYAALVWYDSGNNVIGTTDGSTSVVQSGTWLRLGVTGTAPVGAEWVGVVAVDDATHGSHSRWGVWDIVDVDAVMVTVGGVVPYFDGDTPDTSQFEYAWTGTPNESTSTQVFIGETNTVSPLDDPDCPPLIPAPQPPPIPNACVEEPEQWLRYWVGIPASSVPSWGVVVPNVRLTSFNDAIRQVRFRLYPNPTNLSPFDIDPESFTDEFILSYMPALTVMTIDHELQAAYASVNGGEELPADHLLYGSGGGPMSWGSLSCGYGYYVSVDVTDETVGNINVEIDLVSRF